MTEDDQVTSTFHRAMKLRDEGAYEQAVGLFDAGSASLRKVVHADLQIGRLRRDARDVALC
jgi:hypothetical protein